MRKIVAKEIFTDLERVFEYYEGREATAFVGEERNLFRKHMHSYQLCQNLMDHNFALPFGRKVQRRTAYGKATPVGEALLEFLEGRELLNESKEEGMYLGYKTLCPELLIVTSIADAALTAGGAVVDGVGFVKPLPIRPDNFRFLSGEEVDVAVDALNDLALLMRKKLRSRRVLDAVKSFRRNAKERRAQIMQVAWQGWEKHSKNLLMRLDWGIKKISCCQNTLQKRAGIRRVACRGARLP